MRLRKSLDIPKTLFITSLAGLAFSYGLVAGVYQLFPYSIIRSAVDSTKLVAGEIGMMTGTRPTEHLFDSRYPGSGVMKHSASRVAEGVTVITSFYDGSPEIRLITEDGSPVHRWPISVSEIWPDYEHIPEHERPKTDWNVVLSGITLLPDGSIVFPLLGLVKMSWCGEVMWKVPRMAHHSVSRTSRGGYWVPGKAYVDGESRHPPIKPPYQIDTLLEVSASGELLREIAVLDLFWQEDMLSLLFANNRKFDPQPSRDVVHLNDIEEIPVDWLDRFPQFDQGDLLISLREPNMVMVVNPDSREVKWHQTGPWIQQHDPDWQPDGTFVVFDNNYDRTDNGRYFGGSRVVSVDPRTRETRTLYGGTPEHRLYTATQGLQQVLSNGNILIAESNAGRVIEVDPNGETVWEYINRYSEKKVLRISDAERYPRSYFNNLERRCN